MKSMLTLRNKDNKVGHILAINAPYYEPHFIEEENGNIKLFWTVKYANGGVPETSPSTQNWIVQNQYVITTMINYETLYYNLNKTNEDAVSIFKNYEVPFLDIAIEPNIEDDDEDNDNKISIMKKYLEEQQKDSGIYSALDENKNRFFCVYDQNQNDIEELDFNDLTKGYNLFPQILIDLDIIAEDYQGYITFINEQNFLSAIYLDLKGLKQIQKMELAVNNFYYDKETSILYYYSNEMKTPNLLSYPYVDNRLIALTNPSEGIGVEIVETLPTENIKEDLPYFVSTTQDIYTAKKNENNITQLTRYTHKILMVDNQDNLEEITAQAQVGDLIFCLENPTESTQEINTYCEELMFDGEGNEVQQ